MMRRRRITYAIAVAILAAMPALANITSTSLRIQGAGLRVVNETVTAGIDMPTTVQTEFGGKQNDEAVSLDGVVAVGELTGPGIETPIQLTTAPGYKFQIPGLPQQGVYYLQNVRLMKGTDFLQYASPAVSVITVADLLQTKVSVRQLTPEELRARGITVDARNFDVYEYSFTFIIEGKEVVIPFPVIIDPRTHEVVRVPGEAEYNLPPVKNVEPPRWAPPQLIPMEFGPDEGDLPEESKDPIERAIKGGPAKIPAAIVIPNGLSVLHQFFAVALTVTNGAPEGSSARLEDIKATLKIPTALRTVKTTPQVSFGQPVPIVEPTTGVTFLVAQSRGEAEWTLEGLEPGTHRLDFDLRATLKQDGQADIPMRATPSAAVVVHNPRFNINFSHPDVVRKGIEYSTYMFVTNMSGTEQSVTVKSGVESCDKNPGANVCRLNGEQTDLMTIPANDMRLIEYRLRPNVTGHVFATAGTLSSTDNLSASVSLFMGVSETGIPLSPATLIMPYYAQYVSPELVSKNLMLFGLGYSLATAPLNQMTAKFPRVITTDVFTRAVDIARAGQRIFITDSAAAAKRDTIANLALDLLGNGGYELREWDALRRQEKTGRAAGAAVMRELEATGLADGATMRSFFDAFGDATAHRQGYVAALAHGTATGDRPYAVSVVGRTSTRRSDVANEAESGWVRELAFSDISRFSGAGENGELALVGRWTEDLDVRVTPSTDGPFALEILYPAAEDGSLKKAHFDLIGTKDKTLTIALARGAVSLSALSADGANAASGSITTVQPPPITILGARQDLHLDADGHKVSVLFSRPVGVPTGVDLRTKFTGAIDFNRDNVVYKAPRPISAAALQEDGRTVNTTFDHSLSVNATYTIDVGSLIDPIGGAAVSFAGKIVPKIDNDLPAGIVYGRVVKGDNSPVAGADVLIQQYIPNNSTADPQGTPQYDTSQADGAFLFEFIRRQVDAGWGGTYRLTATHSVQKTTTIEGSVRLPGKVHFVTLQYLGRGAAEGYVKYDDGSVVASAEVVIGSTMFSQFRTTRSDARGYYRVEDLPVGPLTFSATDSAGNVTYAANEVATPGQLVSQNLSIYRKPFPGLGRVTGVVRRNDTMQAMAGIHVGVYSQGYGLRDGFTDANGRFEFDRVPAGFITVLAEEWSVMRQSVAADFDLKANEIRQADLLFLVAPDMKYATLTGEVWRENPLQPGVREKVAGALVKIEGYRVVTADAEGRFTYENIPVVFSQRKITAYDPLTKRVNNSTLPDLTEAGPNHVAIFINAFDRGSGTIRVRLLNAAGSPVPGYRVIVPGFPPDVLHPVAGEPGVYELPDVGVGATYNIKAVPTGVRPPDGQADTRPYGDQMTEGSAAVQFNGHIAALTLRLPGEGTVRVKVRSQFDLITPVTLTYPVWWEGEQSTIQETLTSTTEKNGEADWAVFTKIPALENYGVSSAHPQYGYAGATAQLAFDGDMNEHLLQLNTLAIVRGTVYAIDGVTPVAGASVTISNGHSDPGPQITGPDGRFEFVDQPSDTFVTVVAQVTQSGIYRTGYSAAGTPRNGGVVEGMSVVLRKRGFVDGKVVYKDYKRFDPNNVANNVPDDTPDDYSDNAPVPLAKFYLRELDFPQRSFGRAVEPLQADTGGRFAINNLFVGALRATAWDSNNEELRGDWTGRIDEEGAEAAPKAYIAIGGGGVGSAKITVVDPNQSYAGVPNAEVSLYAGNGRLYDFSSTDAIGTIEFLQLPIGNYTVSAYSKSLGKTSKAEPIAITRDGVAGARLELDFSGTVDGTLTDPEASNAPVPGSVVRLSATNYSTQASSDTAGFFLFRGVREGTFSLDAKDTETNRRAHAERTLSVLDPHRTVNLELEPTDTLHFAAYLPDDYGNKSDVLAPPMRAEAVQRCWAGLDHVRHCDYERQLNGNPIEFPRILKNSGYGVNVWEGGETEPTIHLGGILPLGSAANPLIYVYPAFGEVRVLVTQGGAPASGAKVTINGPNKSVIVYTDANGAAVARDVRLGGISVQASSLDGKFTGSTSVTLQRQSVPVSATIALGTYAGVTGLVEAEAGGPSVGTRVVAHYGSNTAEMRTDGDGRYTFLGIPTPTSGSTGVNLVFIGPDDTTVGGSIGYSVSSADGVATVPTVKLDATSPILEKIDPADGSMNVSPDTAITVTFSEPVTNIATNTFQLVDADGGVVNCTFTTRTLADGKFAVTMHPPKPATGFPLKSNTLYRVIVTNAVHDLSGHSIAATRGFAFTTSDYTEPRVQKVLPASPIPAATTFEFRFNEPIDPSSWQSGGNGVFHVYKLLAPGGPNAAVEKELVARAFTDPASGMALYIAPDDANPIVEESFYRVFFSGVRDPQGNTLEPQTYHFYSFDTVAPSVVFVNPPASEQLVSGSEYEIKVDLRNGSTSGSPATDVKKVDYYTIDANGIEKPFAIVTQPPFSTKILGPEAPGGGTTLKIGAQATDASGNLGPKSSITWNVKPNAPPLNVVVTPAQSAAFPSTQITADVTFEDEGSFASVTMTFNVPRLNGTTETKSVTQSYSRLASGAWPLVRFVYTLPPDAKGGENVTISTVVADVRGLTSTPVTTLIAITTDTIPPSILSTTPPPGTSFFNGDKYTITAIVTDPESTVQSVTFLVDGEPYASASSSVGPNPGQQTFKSVVIEAKSKADDANIPLTVTAKDYAGNPRSKTWEVVYKGVNDPSAPKVAWLCPVDRGAIPALASNFPLKLRLTAVDEDIRAVKFIIGTGGPTVAAAQVGTTSEYTATYTFPQTPAPGPIVITAVVDDTVAAHTVQLPITLDAVAIDQTITDPQAVTADNVASFNGKSIAVIGANAVFAPQVPVTLANLLVLSGGRVETLPATVSREFKLDVTTTGVTYVDCDSSVNVSEKGYVGGWATTTDGQNADPRGRTYGNVNAGGADSSSQGSYAGLGGIARVGTTNLPYGSYIAPRELGSGGGGPPTAPPSYIGASGGGAISLRGGSGDNDASRVVIGGALRADGGHGFSRWAGGSGGSVLLSAKQVLFGPAAVITAIGGDDDGDAIGSWGGGGGRIAIAATMKLDASTASLDARGGRNYNQPENRAVTDGGAGTIYVRRPGQEAGELTVSSYDSRFPASVHTTRPTPVGRIKSGTSTAIAANALTDASRTFDQWMVGEELVVGTTTSRSFTVVGVSSDGKTLLTDPADGSLLALASSQTMPYSGLVVFDKIAVGKRALAVFDDHVAVNGAVDDKSVLAIDATAAVVLQNEQLAVTLTTTPAGGSNVLRDTIVSTTYSVSATAGVRRVEVLWSLDSTQRVDTYDDYPTPTAPKTLALPVPASAPLGAATLKFRITDRAGRTYDLNGASYTVTENQGPQLTGFTVDPASLTTYAGHNVTATITATDDIAVKSITVTPTLAGAALAAIARTPNTPAASEQFVVAVPNDTAGGATLVLDALVSDGTAGHAPVTASRTITILSDANAPSLTVTSPTAGASYRESADKIPVRVTTVDAEVAVKEVFAQLDGGTPVALTRFGTTNEWRLDLTAPPVDGDAPVTHQLTVTTKDYAGNPRVSDPIDLVITPVIDANAPIVSALCGAPGAMFPAGTPVKVRVSAVGANAQNPVQTVEMLLNDVTPVTVTALGNNQYEGTVAIPSNAADGATYRVRAIARSASGASSDLVLSFSAIAGAISTISGDTLIDTTTSTYDGKTLVIAGGTVTIRGEHTFDRLVVLGGRVLAPNRETLSINTTHAMYVACGAMVDMNGAGYYRAWQVTYPNHAAPNDWTGGSHIGRGGVYYEPVGETYGSVYRPQELGSSGRNGGYGGGAIRIKAENVTVDGSIRANGTGENQVGGAGGSVWITSTGRVSGGGSIEALGGNAWSDAGAGGGGAIAVEYRDAASPLPALRATTQAGGRNGAPGSVYTFGPSSTYGDLTIDSGGLAFPTTPLPSLGSGSVVTVAGNVVTTDRSSDIPAYFAGHWVEIRDAAGNVKGSARITAVDARTFTLDGSVSVATGDKWQGIYRFDNVNLNGATLVSNDPIRSNGTQTITGYVETSQISTKNLRLKSGATLTHERGSKLTIDVANELRIDSGATIDASNRGYHRSFQTTYPATAGSNDWTGGSHIGRGGLYYEPVGETYGSVYRPQELGASGRNGGYGGGAIRINAKSLIVDGKILANGLGENQIGGAGGSVWITTGRIEGSGSIETNGGNAWSDAGAGGGGAIAVEYSDAASTLPILKSTTQAGGRNGAPGSIYTFGPSSTYGDLTIDSAGLTSAVPPATVLPSLGKGSVVSVAGNVVTTDRGTDIQPYFAGHWVEIRTAAGVLKGTWRISAVAAKTFTLSGDVVSVAAGDRWQGVYRFDNVTLNAVPLISNDPIRAGSETLSGSIELPYISAENLRLKSGAKLTHARGSSLTIEVANELRVDSGASIDVTDRGYHRTYQSTYPDHAVPGDWSGGSHIGRGGRYYDPIGETYGSVYRPQELGASGRNGGYGGGVIRITAKSLVVDGDIRANGIGENQIGGAGGSIWITTKRISGGGNVEANGGNAWSDAGAGGGGAIAVEYTDATSTMPALKAFTTTGGRNGGPGSIYVFGPSSTYGDVRFDYGGLTGQPVILPSLGSGVAQSGTSGSTVGSDRAKDIPAYFVGHWVEIRDAAGTLKGTWRISAVNAKSFTLAGSGVNVAAGDRWQGVYRFDNAVLKGVTFTSADPLRVTAQTNVEAGVETTALSSQNLRLLGGSVLTHPAGASLTLDVGNELRIDSNAAIDVTGRGYDRSFQATYPATGGTGDWTGGSHLGQGGRYYDPIGETFGSIYRPLELGAGGRNGGFGGGAVRIRAQSVIVDGVIRANGVGENQIGGAGGSVWVTTGRITGSGAIDAKGGNAWSDAGAGGGGAISIVYTDSASVVPPLSAITGPGGRNGGAGTIYTSGPASTYGSLLVDNGGNSVASSQSTVFPSFGRGRVVSVTGATVLTDRGTDIPAYFAGHWVDVFSSGGSRKGTWRIAAVSGKSFTLEPNGTVAPSVVAGDSYRGVYLFDTLTARSASIVLLDDIRWASRDLQGGSTMTTNDAPVFDQSRMDQVVVASRADGDFVTAPAGMVSDLHPPIILTVTNGRTAQTFTANASGDGSFSVPVKGEVGDTFTIRATDSFASLPATTASLPVNGAISDANGIAEVSATPSRTTGGSVVAITVRLLNPVTHASVSTISLASSNPALPLPATINVPLGSSSGVAQVTTGSVAADTNITFTASMNGTTKSGALTLLPGTSALAQLTLTPASVEGGTSINGSVILGAPAPSGGALVSLASSDLRLATVPDVVVVPEGSTSATFTVTTRGVSAQGSVIVTATYGATKSATATLSACTALTTVPAPAAATVEQLWIDDAAPAGTVTQSDAKFDTTQAAAGTSSLHFSGSAAGTRQWSVALTTAVTVNPGDALVAYALINPCNPPRQVMLSWKSGSTTYRASFGENRIDPVANPSLLLGALPGGVWTRIEVPAKRLGIGAATTVNELTIQVVDGEAWIDLAGKAACNTPRAAAPQYGPAEQVWFDDTLPAGAQQQAAGGIVGAWLFDAAQVASGGVAHRHAASSSTAQHTFNGATDGIGVNRNDVLFTYVFVDPCDPPKQIILNWFDGTWEHAAYWGENVVSNSDVTASRTRVGPVPEGGKWVRLDVPANDLGITGMIRGMSFTTSNGQVWFDRSGKVARINVAYHKTATQSPDYTANDPASRAVDGNVATGHGSMSVANYGYRNWWMVDLGAVYPIDTVDVYGRTDCCASQTAEIYLIVSDVPFVSDDLNAILAQPGVSACPFPGNVGTRASFPVHRTGRYVRIVQNRTDYLSIPEVEVFTPVAPSRLNAGVGLASTSSSYWDGWYYATYALNAVRNSPGGSGGSIFHIRNGGDNDAWWEVDLGAVTPISAIDLWDRLDPDWPNQMAGSYILVSDVPFTSTTYATAAAQPGVSIYYYGTGPFKTQVRSVPINRSGRFVRVQRPGTNTSISAAEIEIWGQQSVLMPMSKPPDAQQER